MTIPKDLMCPRLLEQASRRTAPRYHSSHRTTEQQPSRSRRQHSPRSWQASGGSRARLSSQLNQRVPLWISVNCAPWRAVQAICGSRSRPPALCGTTRHDRTNVVAQSRHRRNCRPPCGLATFRWRNCPKPVPPRRRSSHPYARSPSPHRCATRGRRANLRCSQPL